MSLWVELVELPRFDSDGSLILCGPADGKMRRATSFEGVGLCIMHKFEEKHKEAPATVTPPESTSAKHSKLSTFEPDPEFSRNSTEEPAHAVLKMADTNKLGDKGYWMQAAQAASARRGRKQSYPQGMFGIVGLDGVGVPLLIFQ